MAYIYFQSNNTSAGNKIAIQGSALVVNNALVSANNPLPVTGGTSGGTTTYKNPSSTGRDFSANKPVIPNIGQPFGNSGPYANFVNITTIPSNSNRFNVDIENISANMIVIIRDDGTAAANTAPNNASVFTLLGVSPPGAQGGSWSSTTFNGRLQIYSASANSIVTVMED